MRYRVGDLVELTEAGKGRYHHRRSVERRKGGGAVLNASRFDGCFRIKWKGLATPETIHEDFIKPTHPETAPTIDDIPSCGNENDYRNTGGKSGR